MIAESGAIISTDFSEAREVYSSSSCIDNVFYNLVSNAIKYRSKSRTCRIDIKTVAQEGALQILVNDNGIGIDLVKHGGQLFGLYKRFNIETEGKGLGLYLVKAEVESHNGQIEVTSIIDKGTQFKITLPNHRPGTYTIRVA
jgi:signal transduction histidine kinase